MNDTLHRRISDALSAPGGIDSDPVLSAEIEGDESLKALVEEMVRIDGALAAIGVLGDSSGPGGMAEPDWEAMIEGVTRAIEADDDALADGDQIAGDDAFLAAPVFDEDDQALSASERRAPLREEERPVRAIDPLSENVVDLGAARKKKPVLYWLSGLAAAAVVGLGVSVGMQSSMTMNESAPAASVAAEVSEEAEMQAALAAPMPSEMPTPMAAPTASATAAVDMPADSIEPETPSAEPAPAAEFDEGALRGFARGGLGATRSGSRGRGALRGAPDFLSGPGGGGSPRPQAEESARLAERVARAQEARPASIRRDGLHAVEGQIQRCMDARTRRIRVALSLDADAHVTSVNVVEAPSDSAVRSCVVRLLRNHRWTEASAEQQLSAIVRPAPIGGAGSNGPANAVRSRARRLRAAPARPAARSPEPAR